MLDWFTPIIKKKRPPKRALEKLEMFFIGGSDSNLGRGEPTANVGIKILTLGVCLGECRSSLARDATIIPNRGRLALKSHRKLLVGGVISDAPNQAGLYICHCHTIILLLVGSSTALVCAYYTILTVEVKNYFQFLLCRDKAPERTLPQQQLKHLCLPSKLKLLNLVLFL